MAPRPDVCLHSAVRWRRSPPDHDSRMPPGGRELAGPRGWGRVLGAKPSAICEGNLPEGSPAILADFRSNVKCQRPLNAPQRLLGASAPRGARTSGGRALRHFGVGARSAFAATRRSRTHRLAAATTPRRPVAIYRLRTTGRSGAPSHGSLGTAPGGAALDPVAALKLRLSELENDDPPGVSPPGAC